MSDGALASFLQASVRLATPLAFASLGELVVERGGIINIGLEGIIIAGAFGSLALAGVGSLAGGLAGAAAAGVLIAALFALFVVTLRADQIITGTAISMLALGLTGALYTLEFGTAGAALRTPTFAPLPIPGLHSLPIVGPALFNQPVITYSLYGLVPALSWWMSRSQGGLTLRAVGEHPEAAIGAGISPARVRWWAILFGGLMGGIAGGSLVLAQVGTFAEGMSAGRGFIAIAIVALGRWTSQGVAGASLLFGAASALQYLTQARGWSLPYQLSLALPFVVTLVALVAFGGRSAAPAALGKR